MDVSEKNKKCLHKMLAQDVFLTENEILMGKDKDQHITMRSLTLLIFAADLSIVWSTTTLLYLIYIYLIYLIISTVL